MISETIVRSPSPLTSKEYLSTLGGPPTGPDFLPSVALACAYTACLAHLLWIAIKIPQLRGNCVHFFTFSITRLGIFVGRAIGSHKDTPVQRVFGLMLADTMMYYGFAELAMRASWQIDRMQPPNKWVLGPGTNLLVTFGVAALGFLTGCLQMFGTVRESTIEALRFTTLALGTTRTISLLQILEHTSVKSGRVLRGFLTLTVVIAVYQFTSLHYATRHEYLDAERNEIARPEDIFNFPFYLLNALPELLCAIALQATEFELWKQDTQKIGYNLVNQ